MPRSFLITRAAAAAAAAADTFAAEEATDDGGGDALGTMGHGLERKKRRRRKDYLVRREEKGRGGDGSRGEKKKEEAAVHPDISNRPRHPKAEIAEIDEPDKEKEEEKEEDQAAAADTKSQQQLNITDYGDPDKFKLSSITESWEKSQVEFEHFYQTVGLWLVQSSSPLQPQQQEIKKIKVERPDNDVVGVSSDLCQVVRADHDYIDLMVDAVKREVIQDEDDKIPQLLEGVANEGNEREASESDDDDISIDDFFDSDDITDDQEEEEEEEEEESAPPPSGTGEFFNLSQLADVSLAAEGRLFENHPLSKKVKQIRAEKSGDGGGFGSRSHPSHQRQQRLMQIAIPENASHIIICTNDGDKVRNNNNGRPVSKRRHRRDDYTCQDCGKKYSTSSNLARHRQTHRSIDDKKAKRCPYCSKIYVSMPAYSMHLRTHNQTCKCNVCGKSFSRPWLLQGHIRTHTGERPFRCHICPKAFADKSNLRAHVQTHSNSKPYSCKKCGKTFALKSYLCKHEEASCFSKTKQNHN